MTQLPDMKQEQHHDLPPPTYVETQIDEISPAYYRDVFNIDLEASPSLVYLGNSAFRSLEPIPDYNTLRPIVRVSTSDLIHRAIADASTRQQPSGSPYYFRRDVAHACSKESFSRSDEQCVLDLLNSLRPATPGSSYAPSLTTCEADLLRAYMRAIERGRNDLITELLDSGLVDVNTCHPFEYRTKEYLTPLMQAVKFNNHLTAILLLDRGADVNAWSVVKTRTFKTFWGKERLHHILRTPLQDAAANGDLGMVKLLMERYHADDGKVAPTDGQTALRLAADGKHRHVVEYLPARRGGAGLRFKVKWISAVSKINKVLSRVGTVFYWVFFMLPTFFIYGTWLAIKELPDCFFPLLVKIPRLLYKLPGALAEVGRALWRESVRFTKAIPGVCKATAHLCWTLTCRVASAVGAVFSRVLSFLHTCVCAVLTFFQSITWSNIWHGFKDVIHSIFVACPVAVYKFCRLFLKDFVEMTERLLLWVAEVFNCLVILAWQMILFFPKKAMMIFSAIGGVFKHAFKEVIIWFNPKAI